MGVSYQRIKKESEAEIGRLLEERQRIDARISVLKTMVQNCETLLKLPAAKPRSIPVLPDTEIQVITMEIRPDQGITDAIRTVLAQSKIPLSAPEIKSALARLGFDLSEYSNASAVIHNTLTRLERQRQVARVENPASQTVAYTLVKNSFYQRLLDVPNPFGKTLGEMLKEPKK